MILDACTAMTVKERQMIQSQLLVKYIFEKFVSEQAINILHPRIANELCCVCIVDE